MQRQVLSAVNGIGRAPSSRVFCLPCLLVSFRFRSFHSSEREEEANERMGDGGGGDYSISLLRQNDCPNDNHTITVLCIITTHEDYSQWMPNNQFSIVARTRKALSPFLHSELRTSYCAFCFTLSLLYFLHFLLRPLK